MTDRPTHDDLEVMAAGLALGLLEGTERAEALRRQLEDPDFASRVNAWQVQTDRWLEDVEPVEAPASALSAIEHQLENRDANQTLSISNDQGSNNLWRSWAFTATAASLFLAVGLGLAVTNPMQNQDAPAPAGSALLTQTANVAQIKDEAGVPLLSALYNPSLGTLSLRLADLQQPEYGPELWIIPEDGIPRSLGLMDSERLTVTLSPELRSFLQDGATMAVTIEPREGAPHDAPTGDILGTAVLQEVPTNNI
ncbi:anti-sigma factor [Qipengyuania sp. 6B39]|uniref:anti-sigma factor n=1 Tax=Qipengyuania proteolytica TaxID=2867239 RepID=UPI001C89FFB4|nr:anti-sigma factor [Qipengyuania proteolytica]MBX7497221.1 anti-sigma factor [Qipengyuania proteolytica]